MENKRFYWIKLNTDFFNQDTIDFLMSQENGAEYVVLYQMLCLKSANNNGYLATSIEDILIPYDIKKIERDTKYFDIDTITIALGLFKKLGLIYQEENNTLRISGIEKMVGFSSTDEHTKLLNAERQRKYRLNHKNDSNVTVTLKSNVDIDKDIDKDIDIDIDKDIDKKEDIYSSSNELSPAKAVQQIPYDEIIKYLNFRVGTNYKSTTKNTQRLIKARFNEGFTLDDFKQVIDKMSAEWLKDKKMQRYLRPETLFGTKFESYLNKKEVITTKTLAKFYDWSDF